MLWHHDLLFEVQTPNRRLVDIYAGHRPANELYVVLCRARELRPMDFSALSGLGGGSLGGGGAGRLQAELRRGHVITDEERERRQAEAKAKRKPMGTERANLRK